MSMAIEDLDFDHKDGYARYFLPNTDICVFQYHVDTLDGFNMTLEEKALGLKLCLEARLNGNWTGDILKGPYEEVK